MCREIFSTAGLLLASLCIAVKAQVPPLSNLPSCVKEDTLVYLDTLKVHNCLQADGNPTDVNNAVITKATQTITNIGNRDVIVELREDYFRGPALNIYEEGDGKNISRQLMPPQLHNPNFKPPKVGQYPLAPNQSLIFTHIVNDGILSPVREGIKYTIFMRGTIPYRNPEEAEGYGAVLRSNEADRKKQYLRNSEFQNVRLK